MLEGDLSLAALSLSGALVALCVTLIWLVSIPMRDVSIADIWWGPGFTLIAWVTYLVAEPDSGRFMLVLALLTLWGLRLGLYLAWRNLGHAEDRRYQAMRGNSPHFWWTSLFKVFLFQGAIQVVVALPVFTLATSTSPLGPFDVLWAVLALIGVSVEGLADHQLARFKGRPGSEGQVMDEGLWGYSRHPNYFGNALMWCGLGGLAMARWPLVGALGAGLDGLLALEGERRRDA